MTHDQRIIAAAAKRTRDDAEARLAEIERIKAQYVWKMNAEASELDLSDTDEQLLSEHLEDLYADLFADEIKELQTQIETASHIAREDYEDHIANRRKML